MKKLMIGLLILTSHTAFASCRDAVTDFEYAQREVRVTKELTQLKESELSPVISELELSISEIQATRNSRGQYPSQSVIDNLQNQRIELELSKEALKSHSVILAKKYSALSEAHFNVEFSCL